MKNKYLAASAAWALIILAVSIAPGNAIEPVGRLPFSSVLAHFGEFFVFSFLFRRALESEGMSMKRALIITILASFAYSGITEILQLYIPGRFFDYNDMLMNDAGALAGIGRSIYSLVA